MGYEVLISFLRQLRAGYLMRRAGAPFPRSVALLSRWNIRDQRPDEGSENDNTGATSPFNIFTKSVSLPYFTEEQISALYAQYAPPSGLTFDDGAVSAAFRLTKGHPYLVSLLAAEAFGVAGEGPEGRILRLHVDAAAKALLEKSPHLLVPSSR